MTKIKNNYLGNLRTDSLHVPSGNKIITDAPIDNKGRGEAFSPTDLVCASLASCMMTIMGIVAERDGIDISGMTSDVEKFMTSNPRRISEIKIDIKLPAAHNLSDKHRDILKRAAMTCPVTLSLHPEVKQTISFNF
ncbi:MAG: OsmC family protein [Cytophagaceae bacterium]